MYKTIVNLFKISILLSVATLISCRNGKKNPPIITLENSEITMVAGTMLRTTINYERGDRQIKEFRVTGYGEDIVIEDNDDSNNYDYELWIPSDAGGTDITITFVATDKRNNETSVDLIIHVWNEYTNGIISNIQGPSSSSWDLVENKKLITTDASSSKDISDKTSGSTGDFLAGGWSAGANTKFVITDGFDYDNATKVSIKEEYENGDEATIISGSKLIEGAVIIAKLRETEEYAVIKITEVYDDGKNGGTGYNSDYRKFSYKK